MYPTNNADFVNNVASGEGIPCPNCHIMNNPNNKFCITCGTQLINENATQNFVPAFSQIDETEVNEVLNSVKESEMFNENTGNDIFSDNSVADVFSENNATDVFSDINVADVFSESNATEAFSEIKPTEAFAEIKEPEVVPEIKVQKVEQPKVTYVEPESVFAQGLPSWSIEPPQVVVRRRR